MNHSNKKWSCITTLPHSGEPEPSLCKETTTWYKFLDTLTGLLKPIVDISPNSSFSGWLAGCCDSPTSLITPVRKRWRLISHKNHHRRLDMWPRGLIDVWFVESKALQLRIQKIAKGNLTETSHFNRLMHHGKIANTIRHPDSDKEGGLWSMDQKPSESTVLKILKEEHPPTSDKDPSHVIQHENPYIPCDPSIFETINVILKTHDRNGPSGPMNGADYSPPFMHSRMNFVKTLRR